MNSRNSKPRKSARPSGAFKKEGSERPFRSDRKGGSSKNSDVKPYKSRNTDNSDRPSKDGGYKKRTFGSESSRDSVFSKKPYERNSGKGRSSEGGSDYKPRRTFNKDDRGEGREKRPYTRNTRNDFPKREEGGSDYEPRRTFNKDERGEGREKRPFTRNTRSDFPKREEGGSDYKPRRTFNKDDKGEGREKRPFTRNTRSDFPKREEGISDYKPRRTFNKDERGEGREKRPFTRNTRSDFPKREESGSDHKPRKTFNKDDRGEGREKRPYQRKDTSDKKPFLRNSDPEKPFTSFKRDYKSKERGPKKPYESKGGEDTYLGKYFKLKEDRLPESTRRRNFKAPNPDVEIAETETRLNKYIANSGICSRREADELIFAGDISVNGKKVTEMGYKVQPGDVVKYGKRILSREKMMYVLLNKPKDFITTTEDPEERKTVLELVKNACKERIYPVGRLDRNTTGLLLLTNDGELTQKLTHPSFNIKKIYAVELNRPISPEDAQKILDGLYLDEGKAVVDSIAILDETRQNVGIEIHIGWNRIVRRLFETVGYDVVKLDRVMYAGLTKKDLPRGHWRHLTEKEVLTLKHFM
ncbi:MAG: pseudouridine synthase [Bacteroidota bacterium]|nr:pseudouridine synthase [Bacteroidota bacterium]